MQNLQEELIDLLKDEENLVVDGHLNKAKIVEAVLTVNPNFLKLLINNKTFKKHFFQDIEGVLVFDKIAFQRFVNNKSFLPASYTAFKNKIGLTINDGSTDNFINSRNDVSLVWPHKDCVLEGGQTKEDQKRKEIFWNETLAPDNIDRLLSPKVLTNFKKFSKDGKQSVKDFTGKDNLFLKGNNLLSLASLLPIYRGKIKLIYIDPPYNTGNDGFDYNDSFNHSTWLTFLKNRLEIAKQLMRLDGTIAISIDHNELAYLSVLMDELFGIDNRKNIITIKRGSVTGAKVINPGVVNVSEYVLIYSRDSKQWAPNRVFRKKDRDNRYNKFILNYQENFENWKFITLLEAFAQSKGIEKGKLKKELGKEYNEELDSFVMDNKEKVIRFASLDDKSISTSALELKYVSKEDVSKVYSLVREDNRPYYLYKGELVLFAKDRMTNIDGELSFGELISDIWNDVLPNDLHNEGGVELRKGKKPEKLISRLIQLCTDPEDLVLDFFSGSGTTGTVAFKTNRKFILCEQMDYAETLPVQRLKNTIAGDQSGVSKAFNWNGGGSFVYVELMQYNQIYIDKIQSSQSKEEVMDIWKEMEATAFFSYQFDKQTYNDRSKAFQTAPIEYMKKFLVEILDKNQLYVNYSEIEDKTFNVSKEDIQLNKEFYSRKISV